MGRSRNNFRSRPILGSTATVKTPGTIGHFTRWLTTLGAGLATIAADLLQGAAMAYKEVSRVGIAEVIRRWQASESQRHIAAGTGLSRATVVVFQGVV